MINSIYKALMNYSQPEESVETVETMETIEKSIESGSFPLFYRTAVPLNSETHAGLKVSPSPQGFSFASSARTVLLATVEFYDASRHFPIIFRATSDNGILPVVLLGLEEDENLFVDAAGNWTANYIPAYVRRYPFITTNGSEGEVTVCFDESFDGFNLEGGAALFENGEPTAKTREIQAFLQDYLERMQESSLFGTMLFQSGLLRQIDAQANLSDGRTYALNNLLVVDEQKLAQLPDTDIVKLFRSGMLALIHAHLLSLRNLNMLIERKAQREA